jgi:hypothetical protein
MGVQRPTRCPHEQGIGTIGVGPDAPDGPDGYCADARSVAVALWRRRSSSAFSS